LAEQKQDVWASLAKTRCPQPLLLLKQKPDVQKRLLTKTKKTPSHNTRASLANKKVKDHPVQDSHNLYLWKYVNPIQTGLFGSYGTGGVGVGADSASTS